MNEIMMRLVSAVVVDETYQHKWKLEFQNIPNFNNQNSFNYTIYTVKLKHNLNENISFQKLNELYETE